MEAKPNEPINPTYHADNSVACLGLNKREYFAAMIMAGLSANTGNMENTTEADALIAVNAADQLIQALNSKRGE